SSRYASSCVGESSASSKRARSAARSPAYHSASTWTLELAAMVHCRAPTTSERYGRPATSVHGLGEAEYGGAVLGIEELDRRHRSRDDADERVACRLVALHRGEELSHLRRRRFERGHLRRELVHGQCLRVARALRVRHRVVEGAFAG